MSAEGETGIMDRVIVLVVGFVLGDAVGVAGVVNIWDKIVALFA